MCGHPFLHELLRLPVEFLLRDDYLGIVVRRSLVSSTQPTENQRTERPGKTTLESNKTQTDS